MKDFRGGEGEGIVWWSEKCAGEVGCGGDGDKEGGYGGVAAAAECIGCESGGGRLGEDGGSAEGGGGGGGGCADP